MRKREGSSPSPRTKCQAMRTKIRSFYKTPIFFGVFYFKLLLVKIFIQIPINLNRIHSNFDPVDEFLQKAASDIKLQTPQTVQISQ